MFPSGRRRDGSLYYRPHCWSCKYAKNDKGRSKEQHVRDYHRSYYRTHKLDIKYKSYMHKHKKFSGNPIEKEHAIKLMMSPCTYCGLQNSHGIDRKDSSLGYIPENCVPCCEQCNNLLGDIPNLAKIELIPGLRSIREKELLSEWIIPTSRRRGAALA